MDNIESLTLLRISNMTKVATNCDDCEPVQQLKIVESTCVVVYSKLFCPFSGRY